MKNNHKTVPQNMDTGCTQLLFSDCKIPSILAWNVSAVVLKAADKKIIVYENYERIYTCLSSLHDDSHSLRLEETFGSHRKL